MLNIFYLPFLILNVPLQIGKCTPRGTCSLTSGVQRSGDARGDCLIVCSSTKFWFWALAYGGHCYWIYAVYDVILTFANQRFGEVSWHNMHIILHQWSSPFFV